MSALAHTGRGLGRTAKREASMTAVLGRAWLVLPREPPLGQHVRALLGRLRGVVGARDEHRERALAQVLLAVYMEGRGELRQPNPHLLCGCVQGPL